MGAEKTSEECKEELQKLEQQIEDAKKERLGGDSADDLLKDKAGKGGDFGGQEIKCRRVLKGHFGKVYSMHWAGTNAPEKLVSASQDGKLIVWNAQTTNKTQAIPLRSSWVMTCAYEHTSNNLVACGGLDNLCSIYTIDTENPNGKAEKELAHHDGYLSCCRFIDEKKMITSSGDSTCILWDVNSQNVEVQFQEHASDVMSVAVCPTDPNIFVSGSCDAKCIAHDLRTKHKINTFEGHESDINSVTFFPDGKGFGTGSDDSSCRFFDMRSFNQVASFAADHIFCGVTSSSFSRSGRVLYGGYDDYSVHSWDTLTSAYKKFVFHENRVSCLGVEPCGNALCSGSWDTLLKVLA